MLPIRETCIRKKYHTYTLRSRHIGNKKENIIHTIVLKLKDFKYKVNKTQLNITINHPIHFSQKIR